MIENIPGLRVTNALLRCVRSDSLAQPLFERVNSQLGLWVWEIPTRNDVSLDQWMDETYNLLASHTPFLSALRSGSRDYTLFVEVADAARPVRISHPMLSVAFTAGFEIEVYFAGD